MENLTKKELEQIIKTKLNDNPKPEMLKKLKRLAMSKNIKMGVLRKNYCKKCYSLFPINSEIRIKKGLKKVVCKNCGHITIYRLK